jgi:hypothetical protein
MVRNANEHPTGDQLVVNEYFCNIAKINKQMVLEWGKTLTQTAKGRIKENLNSNSTKL